MKVEIGMQDTQSTLELEVKEATITLMAEPDAENASAQSNGHAAKRANELDGSTWLSNSVSVWSDIRKSAEELSLKHPAMFPSMLVERLIRSLTTSDEQVILDPFMGSGSTLVAARKMGRTGIGFELNQEYIGLAKQRLSQYVLGEETEPAYKIYDADSRCMADYVPNNTVDLTVTSPPYWDILNQKRSADYKDTRHYGNYDGDLGNVPDYEHFIEQLQRVFTQVHRVMRPDRYCIVVVMDLRKKDKFFPFHSDVAKMMQQVGFIYDDLVIWNRQSEYNNLRPLGYPYVFRVNKVHEFVLIFKTREASQKRLFDEQLFS